MKKMDDAGYRDCWDALPHIEIRMIEKHGECRHALHDTFEYTSPYQRPTGVCPALLNVLDLYIWRLVLGFPSWNEDDRAVYVIHCPDRTGTVWEMRAVANPRSPSQADGI